MNLFLLTELLDESKLSIIQRKSIWNSMKKGESLPGPQKQENYRDVLKKGEILIAPSFPRKRSLDTIKQSGAYEREQVLPPCNKGIRNILLVYLFLQLIVYEIIV